MKVWAFLPLLVQVAIAISPRELYNNKHQALRRDRSGHRLPHAAFKRFDHGRCNVTLSTTTAVRVSSTSSRIAPTTTSTKNVEHVVSSTTSTPVIVKASTSSKAPASTTTTHVTSPTTTSVSSSGGGGGGDTSNADIQAYLTAHNTVRANHGAVALTWNNTLASAAQTWADKCIWQHSGGAVGPYGENLAAGSGDYSIASAVGSWANEESEYDSSNPQPSHYTQMVWKATTQLGCAVISCDLPVFTSNFWPAKYYVCEYHPQGNVIGEFAQEVQ